LTSALAVGEWSVSRHGRVNPGERAPGTHWIGGWVDPRADLDDVEKRKFLVLPGLELQPLGRSARSQSLYRLRYPGSIHVEKLLLITCSGKNALSKWHFGRTLITNLVRSCRTTKSIFLNPTKVFKLMFHLEATFPVWAVPST
jgi:hypothetical protein